MCVHYVSNFSFSKIITFDKNIIRIHIYSCFIFTIPEDDSTDPDVGHIVLKSHLQNGIIDFFIMSKDYVCCKFSQDELNLQSSFKTYMGNNFRNLKHFRK